MTGPTYHVQSGNQTNVGDALGALDSGLNDVKTQIGKVGTGLVTQDTPTSAITVGALTGGTELNIANKDGVARKITNVAAGDVSSDSLNAINGSQLFSAGQGLATAIGGGAALNKDGSITQPTFIVGGTSVHNVGDALSNIDGRVTTNTTDIAGIKEQLGHHRFVGKLGDVRLGSARQGHLGRQGCHDVGIADEPDGRQIVG